MRCLAVLLALGLAACEQEVHEPAGPLAPALPAATGAAATAPAEPSAYQYRSTALRSPFEPGHAGALQPAEGLQPDPARPQEPLERFRLDELRMVGSMGAGGRRYALVEDPTGRIHRVAIGDRLGRHHGRIDRLDRESVALREIVRDVSGAWGWRQRSLALARPEQAAAAAHPPAVASEGETGESQDAPKTPSTHTSEDS